MWADDIQGADGNRIRTTSCSSGPRFSFVLSPHIRASE